MALEERFGVGQNIILGVQANPGPLVSATATVATASIGPTTDVNPWSVNVDVTATLPAAIILTPNTRSFDYTWTVSGAADALASTIRRLNGASNDLVRTVSAAGVYTGSDSNEYSNLLNETIRLTLTSTGNSVDLAATLVISNYTATFQPTISLDGVKLINTNLEDERSALVDFTYNNETFTLRLTFRDETLSSKTFSGKPKERTDD